MADPATDNPFAALWGTQPSDAPNPFAQFVAPAPAATPDPDIFASAIKNAGEKSSETAVSSKGAKSSMQVMDATARSPGFGVKPAEGSDDLDREGRDYSQALLRHYGDPTLATAAYDAGPGNVDKWLAKYGDPRKGEISTQDFTDRIPYRETRNYVNRVSGYLGGTQAAPQGGAEPVNFQTVADRSTAPANDNPFAAFAQPTPSAKSSNPFAQFAPVKTPPPDTGILAAPVEGLEQGLTGVGKTVDVLEGELGPWATILAHALPLVTGGPEGVAQERTLASLEQAGHAAPAAPTVASQPLTLAGGFDPHSIAEKSLYGVGESVPTLVGAIAGGPLGAVAGTAAQTYGPAVEEHKGNASAAAIDTAIDSAFSGLGFKAFELAPFKGTVKNLMAQGLGIQPAIAMAERAVANYANGKPLTEGLPDEYLRGALPNTLLMGLGHLPGAILGHGAPETQGARGATPPPPPNTGFEQPPLPQLPPPSGGGPHPEAIDAEFSEIPPAGTPIGLKMPSGTPQRATVVGTFENGKFTTVQFENGQHRDYRTEDVIRDLTEAPPRATEPTEPSVPHAPISESERFDLEGDYLPPAQGGREPSQPTLNSDAIKALEQARGLEQAAMAPASGQFAPSSEERMAYMKQAALLRQQYGVPDEAGTTYKHPLAGDPADGLGELANARLRNPALYDPNAARPAFMAADKPDPDYAAALADVKMARFPARNEPDLFQTIKSFGGLRTKDADGNPTPDTANLGAVLQDVKYPGLINNKSGMSPDYMREALAQRGWFGGNRDPGQTDLNDFYNLVSQQAQGGRVYHPESTLAAEQAVRDGLDEEMTRAGVATTDSHQDAARKLVEFRQSERADLLAWELDHRTDQILSTLDPADQERLKSHGYEPGADLGAEHEPPESPGGNEPRSGIESGGEGDRAEGPRSVADQRAVTPASVTAAATPEGIVEPHLFAAPEASRADLKKIAGKRAIEEAAQLPRAHGKKAQKAANEGLFKPEEAAHGDLLGTAAKPVDVKTAADVKLAERHVETSPSEAQTEAGNYEKGHLKLHGLDVAIENPAGSERKGVGPDGEPWSVTLQHPYGYVKGTKGADGDHVDVYIGPHPESRDVFVVDQVDPKTKKFDETKAILGANNIDQARAIYDAGFSDGSGPDRRAAITAVNVEDFKTFLDEGDHKKPFAKSAEAKDAALPTQLAEEGEEYAPTFFSALTRGVENAKQSKAPAAQWKGVLKNLPGVKDEERAWSGVDDWLDAQRGPVTKADLLRYVRENEVRVQEVEHSGSGSDPDNFTSPKFANYVLPGGTDYRELLLTLPPKDTVTRERTENPPGWGGGPNENQGFIERGNTGADFRSGHWDEPNVLAHVRFDDRTGPNGERVLHMAEAQSDWHQSGRKRGYADPKAREKFQEAERAVAAMRPEVSEMLRRNDYLGFDSVGASRAALVSEPVTAWEFNTPEDKALAERWRTAQLLAHDLSKAEQAAVPDAPFKTSWHELALKRMVRYAAERGYDRLSWDTGDTNADRYDLSKQVDSIRAQKQKDGKYLLSAKRKHVRGPMGAGWERIAADVPEDDLANHVGKDLAGKIASDLATHGQVVFSGVDLKVGGHGMRGFYDKVLPAAANKIAKKWGVKVESSAVGDERAQKGYEVGRSGESFAVFRNTGGEPISKHETEDEAEAAAQKLNEASGNATTTVHSLPITPEMRDSVMRGQALFQPGAHYKLTEDDIGTATADHYRDLSRNFDRMIRRSGTPRSPEGLTDAVAKYLVDRGDMTGHETLAVYDARTHEVSHVSTSGAPSFVQFDDTLTHQMADPAEALVLYHNHPSGRSLSSSDVATLAMPGVRWIVAYSPDGHVYAARLTPRFRDLVHQLQPGDNANGVMGRRAEAILNAARQISSAVRDEMIKHIVNGDITRDDANDLHARLVNSIMAHEGLIEYVSTKGFSPNEARISDDIASVIGTKAGYRPSRPVQRADGIARILEDVGRDATERSGSSLNPARNFGLSRSAGEGWTGGLADPPKEYEDAPVNAPEGRDYQDNVAEALGAELGEKGAGTYARKMAAGFKEDKGRPEKHLSGKGLAGDLAAVEREIIMPRTLAATDWRSAKYWEAWRKRDDTAGALLHQAAEGSKSYVALVDSQRNNLHAAEELARLKGVVLDDDGRPIVMRNDLGITPMALRQMPEGEIVDRLHASGIDPADAREAAKQVKAGYATAIERVLDHLNPPLAHSKYGQVIELDPETTKAFFERRDLFRQRWRDLMKGAAMKLGWHGSLDPKDIREAAGAAKTGAERKQLEHVADLIEAMGAQERPGYVPFMRFGDYFVAVTPKAGKDMESLGGFPRVVHFAMVDSAPPLEEVLRKWNITARREGEIPKSAKDKIAELRRRYPASHYDIEHNYVSRRPEQLRNLDIPAVEKLLTMLGQKDTGLFAPMVDELREKMYEEMKAGFKKKALSVPGWDGDFARVSGTYLHWTSNHVADLTHREDIRTAKEQYVDRHPNSGTKDYWTRWAAYQDAPETKMRALQKLGFYWELACNPSSTLAIALHAPMAGTFTLGVGLKGAGDVGGLKIASSHLYPALAQAYKGSRLDADHGWHIDIAKIPNLSAPERAAMGRAETSGLLHAAAAEDLAGMMQHGSEALGENRKLWNRGLRVAASNISAVDRANRVGMWLAAYRMAGKPGILSQWDRVWHDNQLWREMSDTGMTPEKAARFMVDEGAFVWGKRNRPQMTRGWLGALIFPFRGFEMNFLSQGWKLFHRMGAEGRLQGLLMMGALASFAGLQGLPFVGDVEDIFEDLGKLFRIDPMIEAHLYSLMEHSMFSKAAADLVLKGAPRAILGVDLSNRLGFGQVVTRDMDTNPLSAMFVVPGIMWNSVAGAIDRLEHGQPLGAIGSLLPAVLRNPWTAAVTWTHEGVRTKNQEPWQIPVMSPQQLSTFDLAVRGAGFQPTSVSRAYDSRIFNERANAAARAAKPARVTSGFIRPAPNNPYP